MDIEVGVYFAVGVLDKRAFDQMVGEVKACLLFSPYVFINLAGMADHQSISVIGSSSPLLLRGVVTPSRVTWRSWDEARSRSIFLCVHPKLVAG